MPIAGLTTKSDTKIETSQLGKAWKGAKKQQNRAGADLKDKFRLDIPPPFDQVIKAQYGTMEPTELRVFFPHQTTDEVFETWNDATTIQGLKHRCNGDLIIREVVTKTGYRGGKPYPKRCGQDCDRPCQKKPDEAICSECTSTGYLKFYIRELFGVAGMQQVIVQTVSGINDVVGVTKQLRGFEEKYGSLSKASIPSPLTFGYIPFVLRRVPKDISRPVYDGKAKKYTGGYTRGEAWPIKITEDEQWLSFWNTYLRKQMILQMAAQGQLALLQPEDYALYQEMSKLELPMVQPQAQLPVAEVEQKAIAPATTETSEQPALEPSAEVPDAIAVEPVVDTFAAADQDANAEYQAEMLGRPSKDRIAAVNEHTKLSREEMLELWEQTNQSLEEPEKTSEMIELMLLRFAEGHMVQQRDAMKLIVRLQDDLGVVDEGLTELFVNELPNHIRPAQKEQPTTFQGKGID